MKFYFPMLEFAPSRLSRSFFRKPRKSSEITAYLKKRPPLWYHFSLPASVSLGVPVVFSNFEDFCNRPDLSLKSTAGKPAG